jgi:hypothetical protein
MIRRERSVHAVERALSAAEGHVQDLGAGLPDPDPETGSGVSADGLLTLSASQVAEARA